MKLAQYIFICSLNIYMKIPLTQYFINIMWQVCSIADMMKIQWFYCNRYRINQD